MPFTVVSFHAHPDDEALFTAGTLARAVAEGHRVVLVTATDGGAGLAASRPDCAPAPGCDLGERRLAELRAAAAALGIDDVRYLGYEDSGPATRPAIPADRVRESGNPERGGGHYRPGAFAGCDATEAAGRLRAILDEVGADVLTIYDAAGGYGHPDHIRVHQVGRAAAEQAGTAVVLEATVDRRALIRVLRFMRVTGLTRLFELDPLEWGPDRFHHAYTDPAQITHRVDVRGYAGQKRKAMEAHATQATADEGMRTLAVFRRLPAPLFSRVFGHEWFVEEGRSRSGARLDDIFASLRTPGGGASRLS